MKKLENIERLNDNRYFQTKDGSLEFPLNLNEINYASHIDLSKKEYLEGKGEAKSDLPTLYDLVKSGELIEKLYQEEVCLDTDKFPRRPQYKKWMQFFKARGFNVTREALKHNYEAWYLDSKSGYRDEKNNYHLFTPCGCNPLSFTATRLDDKFDWEETYGHPFQD